MIFLIIAVVPFVNLILQGKIARLNYDVEAIKKDIAIIEENNNVLNTKISELTSFERIKAVVEEKGLSYIRENILTVSNN
jgi:cell division protein FtsL